MADAYESFADRVMCTLAAQMSGVTREQVIARAKLTFPDEDAFREFVEASSGQIEQQIARAQARLKPE